MSHPVVTAGDNSNAISNASVATLDNPADVLRTMRGMNKAQTVRNEELFGPVTNDTVVIAIQGLTISLFIFII